MWLRIAAAAAVVAGGAALYMLEGGDDEAVAMAAVESAPESIRPRRAEPRAYRPHRSEPRPAFTDARLPKLKPELPPDEPGSVEEEEQAEQEIWKQYQDDFAEEARDSSWASTAERDVSDGLAQIVVPFGGSVSEVECRSSRCQARLSWPDGANVEELSMFALHRSHKAMNCARHMRVNDTEDTTLMFEC